MGIQRHLKAVFIFARKYHRDGVADYLPYMANGLQHVLNVAQNYPEFKAFHHWMRDEIVPRYVAKGVLA
jgi:N-acetylmuramate 1-kinase